MAKNNQRGRNNNNSEGRNQYSNGWMDTARERPFAAAATAAAAVGAGVFLWSRRNQISDQISNLSDQIGDWTSSNSGGDFEMAGGTNQNLGMSETGGGNASLGRSSGGGGSTGSASGRGRAQQTPTG